ncbi:MAG: YARHG domain-containing protein [Pyrinomonadaceae bacterium]|nr:YARHG domain-containing protein [Pyrinomonadaceae bacterium]
MKTCLSLLIILCVAFAVDAQTNLKKWETFNYAKQKVSAVELKKLESYEVQFVRGIVFGKRGRIFKEKSIQEYLAKRPWYKADKMFNNSQLNAMERANLDIIRGVEAEQSDKIQPGDLRFWQKKAIPEDKLYDYTAAEWRIIGAEIEAIHGKTFPDEPWMQNYFAERYWYKPNANYKGTILTEIERANLETIAKKRAESNKVAVSPGDMDKFQNALLTNELLEGVTLNDLRVMRNEFFARHGKSFSTPGYRSFFEWQDWYKPAKDQTKITPLNETEKKNVELLQQRENQFRENIAKNPIQAETLNGLFTEDLRILRNEIYARRGRIFQTKDLKDYFAEQSWYKPNPDYNDSQLSKVETDNLKLIAEAETNAVSKFRLVEG